MVERNAWGLLYKVHLLSNPEYLTDSAIIITCSRFSEPASAHMCGVYPPKLLPCVKGPYTFLGFCHVAERHRFKGEVQFARVGSFDPKVEKYLIRT